ncbi:L-Aspartase-like protein [Rhypophila decipiens]|uniref:L-Aspartase-like protein n=1 Tax=Rhypophila decipiens TaxID=261697 RepID=A0AAN6YD43_9PEZI|nr:L-Aspartase-like protein [Rhypophila decipiens]
MTRYDQASWLMDGSVWLGKQARIRILGVSVIQGGRYGKLAREILASTNSGSSGSAWTFTDIVLSQWRSPVSSSKTTLPISGEDLSIADVVAVSRHLSHVVLASASIGRLLFSQITEILNPATSWGLPPNLYSDNSNNSFLFKGIDVVVAALTSELGFLANPVETHVMTGEMGNQSLNSMALVSARYTLEAVDVLSQLASAHLLAVCQALDLRPWRLRVVRRELGVPFLGEEHLAQQEAVVESGEAPSIGLYNTRVYGSIRSGLRLYELVIQCLREAERSEQEAE